MKYCEIWFSQCVSYFLQPQFGAVFICLQFAIGRYISTE